MLLRDRSGLLLLVVFMAAPSFSGQLSDFEKELNKPREHSHSHSSLFDEDESFLGSLISGIFSSSRKRKTSDAIYGYVPTEEGASRYTRVASGSVGGVATARVLMNDPPEGKHIPGTVAAPFVRFDYRWQYLDADSFAHDYLLEAGYTYFALYGRVSNFTDRDANEDLDIEQYYGMIRVFGSGHHDPISAQLGLGLGVWEITGEGRQGSGAITVPMSVSYRDIVGLEFRPAWANFNGNAVSDYDLSVSAGYKYAQLRLGYRWFWLRGEGHWLNGPYAGVAVMF